MLAKAVGANAVAAPSWVSRYLVPSRARWPLGVALLTGLYWSLAHLGFALQFAGPVAAIVWLPVGVGIAFLTIGGLEFWPGVLIGDLLVNDYGALPLGTAVAQTVGNVLEVVVAAVLIRRIARRGDPLGNAEGLAKTFVALAVGTLISATVGVVASRAGGIVSFGAAPRVWRTWWLGDLSGALIIVPLALAWRHPPRRRHAPREWVEAALVLGAVLAVTEASFHTSRPLTYVVFPALIWSAIRLGRRGATLSVAIASGLVLWNTTHYEGPFVFRSISESVLATQLFIVVAAMTTLALAVVVAEREEMAERLDASRNRLLTVAEAERRRIERNLHDGAQQRLVSLGLQLRMAREHVAGPPEDTATALASAESELETATDELRDLVRGLHPVVLRELSFASALQSLGTHSTIPVSFVELPDAELDPVVEETAYYVVAEALTNAQRHSRAATVEVRVAVDDGTLRLEVRDDGTGGANEAAGSGLRGLRERVGRVGGVFSVESPPGGGTTVVALVPCR